MPTLRENLRRIKYARSHYVYAAIERAANGRALSGPFAGMCLVSPAPFAPYLLGTYELETHPILERLIAKGFARILNVGAAEGYLVIGMARRCPNSLFTAFEMDAERCRDFQANAEANGVAERITLFGKCERPELARELADGKATLILMDVEGYELELLDPVAVPALSAATIFVETHDFCAPNCASLLRERFAATHQIETIPTRPRKIEDFPLPTLRTRKFLAQAVAQSLEEGRPAPQVFLLLTPHNAVKTL